MRFPLFTLALLTAVSACDPCAGTASCGTTTPRLAIDGQIVRPQDGRGVDGVRIDVIRAGGASMQSDSLSAVTSNGGFWHVETRLTTSGDALVNVHVTSPLLAHPYTVSALDIPPTTRAGDAYQLDRWVSDLYFPYYVQFYRRGRPDELFPSTAVNFHQTGGGLLRGAGPDSVVHTGTDSYGLAQMFVYNAFASDTGEVVGDVSVDLPAPLGTSVVKGVRLDPTYVYRAPGIVPRLGVGPSLEYSSAVFDRATGRTIPGIVVDFARVGGVETDPATFTTSTDQFGYAHFHALPLGAGNVIADITLHPPIGNAETFRDTFPTFDSDVPRLHANWTAGAVFPYYGIVRSFGKNVVGMSVRVRRTGGIAVTPEDTVVTTFDNGVLLLNPRPLAAGNVTLELTFTPPAPYPKFVVHNVVLSTVQRDTQGINVWIWDLDKGINGPPGSQVEILP